MSLPLATIDQFINFGISILTMQISKRPFFLEPKVLLILRIIYLVSNLLQVLFYLIIRKRIQSVNDQRTLKIKKEGNMFQENNDVEEEIEISYSEYDLRELNKASKSALLQGLIVTLLHFKWQIIQPLLITGTVPIRNCILNPLYRRYIFGSEILRPLELNTLFTKAETQEAVLNKKRKKEE
ncbi:inorganic phosphate transport protein (PHO88) [Vairimorpha necatrix]|uniref:Inorganic phosphate transport protein (PHO88) n=1 Tax=Vairimorpha necatrix TaxID=6039 RepID=A0AAX4J857_9MICR